MHFILSKQIWILHWIHLSNGNFSIKKKACNRINRIELVSINLQSACSILVIRFLLYDCLTYSVGVYAFILIHVIIQVS